MSLIQEAQDAMSKLHDLTIGLKDGVPPDAYSVLGYQSEIMRIHYQLGIEMSQRFGGKERAYLSRKIAQAREHKRGRVTLKMTSKDAEEAAFVAVEKEYRDEIDAMELFELYRVLMKSLQNAFEFARSVVSFVKTSEAAPH